MNDAVNDLNALVDSMRPQAGQPVGFHMLFPPQNLLVSQTEIDAAVRSATPVTHEYSGQKTDRGSQQRAVR